MTEFLNDRTLREPSTQWDAPDTEEPETAPIPQGTRVIHDGQRGTVLRGNGMYTLVRWDAPQWIAGMRFDQTPVPTKELVVEREAQPRLKRDSEDTDRMLADRGIVRGDDFWELAKDLARGQQR